MEDNRKISNYFSLRYKTKKKRKIQRIEASDCKPKGIHYKTLKKIVKFIIRYQNINEKYNP